MASRGRPKNSEPGEKVEVTITPKLAKYLDILKAKEGFGNSRPEIMRNFVWSEVNRLIAERRLDEIK